MKLLTACLLFATATTFTICAAVGSGVGVVMNGKLLSGGEVLSLFLLAMGVGLSLWLVLGEYKK